MSVPGKGPSSRTLTKFFDKSSVVLETQTKSSDLRTRMTITEVFHLPYVFIATERPSFLDQTFSMVKEIAASVFCLKVVRYAIYLWLPLYLKQEVNLASRKREVDRDEFRFSSTIRKRTRVFSPPCSISAVSRAVQRLVLFSAGKMTRREGSLETKIRFS